MKEIFLSHSSKDELIAKSLCRYLEKNGLSCWISFRDIEKGEPYARGIVRGIKETKAVVLIFSMYSNISENVLNEIDQAFRLNRKIIPFRISDVEMCDELKYYLSRRQWIDGKYNIKESFPEILQSCKKSLEIINPVGVLNVKKTPTWASFAREEQKDVIMHMLSCMIEVQGGTFSMGATEEQRNEAYEWEKPVHNVTLSDFLILDHTITQEEWCAVLPSNPSSEKGQRLPVNNVTWEDCIEFVNALNELAGLCFRLPTEAQWEFAARGGIFHKGYKYSGSADINEVAWYKDNSHGKVHPVRQKKANEIGLYDMSGNVWEWCDDWYDVYDKQATTDPIGALSGTRKVIRCGGADCNASCCRVSYRIGRIPSTFREKFLGFRLVL